MDFDLPTLLAVEAFVAAISALEKSPKYAKKQAARSLIAFRDSCRIDHGRLSCSSNCNRASN